MQAEPEIFDKPYKGMGAESGGVVGMLEVIERRAFSNGETAGMRQISHHTPI